MLEHVAVHGDDNLTACDLKLHELLVSYAYEKSNRTMDVAEYAMPTAYAVRYLGAAPRKDGEGQKGARRRELRDSLERLRSTIVSYGLKDGRRFENVPMLCAWVEGQGGSDEIRYTIPSPICDLMAHQERYAYVELAALARMRSRYGVHLYRHLAYALRLQKWVAGLENLHEVTVSVADMKTWLGWSGDHIGQLQLRGLKPAVADLAHVRGFSLVKIDPVKGRRRGGGIDGWTLTLRLNEPSAHHGRMQEVPDEVRRIVGGMDIPMYRMRQDVWQRKGQFLIDSGHVGGFSVAFTAWLVALDEALTGNPVTDGFTSRRWRGERLMDKVRSAGPEEAVALFLAEEVAAPDLIVLPQETAARRERLLREREARKARARRWQEYRDQHNLGKKKEKPKAPAPVAAAAPKTAPKGERLTYVEFLIDPVVPLDDIEAMHEAILAIPMSGDEDAPVEAGIRYYSGLGTDVMLLGDLPLADADVSFIASMYDRLIEKVVVLKGEA